MVGRLTKQKNQIQVLKVINDMIDVLDPAFIIYIVGDNNWDEGLRIKNFIYENNLSKKTILLDAQKRY